jgi:5-methylcytosine-specific restriction endonuclease McrA
MTDRIDRFKARRQLQAKLREEPTLVALPESADALAMLQQSIDSQRVDLAFSALSIDFDTRVSEAEVDAALLDFTNTFNGKRFDQLMTDSRREMLQAVVVPFGLGKVLSVYDKVGGNVDTIHNARKEVYATDEARNSYAKVPSMDKALRKTFDRDSRYVDKNRRDTTDQARGDLRDAYTGETFGPKQLDKRNLDHTISAAEIHRDSGRDLAGLEALPLANSASNLNPTKERFNKSKGDQKVENLVKRLQREAPARRERIAELQSKSASELTIKERNELQLNLEKQTIADNPEMILAKDKAARAEYEAKLSDAYYKSEKFKKNVIDTSMKEGGKMAFQQAFGLMLAEFFAATFDELQDFYRNGAAHDRWWPELRSRMERVACRVGSKWKEALAAGGAGFVAGVLSNLITVFLNTLMTTSKRVIRMFREGLMSLLRALKTLAMPPKGMTFREAAHEALKVIGAGAIVIGGVALEEFVEKFILTIPGLGLIGSLVSAVIIGALTGITSVFVVYLIDRLDPLGVNRSRKLNALHKHLDRELDAVMGRNDGLLLRLEATLEC